MKKLLLLGGFAFAGILITGGVSFLINIVVFSGTEYDPILVWGFIIIPSSLFVGSCFTGYFSQPYRKANLRRSLLIAPGFYGAARQPVTRDSGGHFVIDTMHPEFTPILTYLEIFGVLVLAGAGLLIAKKMNSVKRR